MDLTIPPLDSALHAKVTALAAKLGPMVDAMVEDQRIPRNELHEHIHAELQANLDEWQELTGQRAAPVEFEGIWRSMEADEYAAHALVTRCAPPPKAPSAELRKAAQARAESDFREWGPGVFLSDVLQSWLAEWADSERKPIEL